MSEASSTSGLVGAAGNAEAPSIPPAEVGELVAMLVKVARARQLYDDNNPTYQRFIENLRAAFAALLSRAGTLQFVVEEAGLRWEGNLFPAGEGRDSLSFLFYKDGIRFLTFLPGFESELDHFLELLQRARQPEQAGDDLVTLLWSEEFSGFRYSYVDLLAEGEQPRGLESGPVELPGFRGGAAQAEGAEGSEDAGPLEGWTPKQELATTGPLVPGFQETLYFLDPHELRQLEKELEAEWSRDLKADVLKALLDRLEDPIPARQREVLEILRQLLPMFLSRGELGSAAEILRELDALAARSGTLESAVRAEIDALVAQVSDPVVLRQLVQSLEDGTIQPKAQDLTIFFAHLRPTALPFLLGSAESSRVPAVREQIQVAIDRLARAQSEQVIVALASEISAVAAGAARLAGQLKLRQAVPALSSLLQRPEASLRLATVEALVALGVPDAMAALHKALSDADREVRIAAVRGLGGSGHRASSARLEQALRTREVREADLKEKIAFFEAYGALAGNASIGLLNELLNGRRLLRRRQPSDIRACAALALGRVGTPEARKALERAAAEADPVVRNAVARALRQEEAAL
ncbi:MAG: HEAT repeat domain-containing protein [Gemmatimonadetes bacterium]|nr:HEAT repeat domain-containing protein [Gemmatimonadota bacterium]